MSQPYRRPITLVLAVLALVELLTLGATVKPPTIEARAAAAYTANCAGCHGATGKGDGPLTRPEAWRDMEGVDTSRKPVNFTKDWFRFGDSPAEVAKTISAGIPDTAMTGFPDSYSPQMVQALAKHVLKLRGPVSNAVIRKRYPERIPKGVTGPRHRPFGSPRQGH